MTWNSDDYSKGLSVGEFGNPISPESRSTVEDELEDGETIEWIGQPVPRMFTAKTTSLFLFAIPWTAFAIFWMCGAAGFKIPDFRGPNSYFMLFGLPFVAIGLGMLSAPFREKRNMRRTVYAITDRRAITCEGKGTSIAVNSFSPDIFDAISRKQRKGDTGDIVFAPARDGTPDAGFFNIRNVREVERKLRELHKNSVKNNDESSSPFETD